jgi:hypothetical protein
MAFVEPYDPTTPTDLSDASQGDDRIRELKRALTERLSQVITGWPNTDPLKLKASALENAGTTGSGATIKFGTAAAKPNPPDTTFYWEEDTNTLWVAEGATWIRASSAATAATTTQPHWGSLRRQTIIATHTQAITNVDVAIPIAVNPLSGGAVGDYILVGCKIRIKKSTEVSYKNEWSWGGSESNNTAIPLNGSAAANVAANNLLGDLAASLIAVRETWSGADVTYRLMVEVLPQAAAFNATINIEYTLYLLAFTSTAPTQDVIA